MRGLPQLPLLVQALRLPLRRHVWTRHGRLAASSRTLPNVARLFHVSGLVLPLLLCAPVPGADAQVPGPRFLPVRSWAGPDVPSDGYMPDDGYMPGLHSTVHDQIAERAIG